MRSEYKQITLENWTKPDPANECFVGILPDGTSRAIKAEEYLTDILRHKLGDHVPEDIHKLFEVARGIMTYGYYYYPIFTMATEQLFRILESSVSHVCKTLGSPAPIKTYNTKIEWLIKKGILRDEEKERWDSIRRLRNSRSHPKNQMILPPGCTIDLLSAISDDINSLFLKMRKYQEVKHINTEQSDSVGPR